MLYLNMCCNCIETHMANYVFIYYFWVLKLIMYTDKRSKTHLFVYWNDRVKNWTIIPQPIKIFYFSNNTEKSKTLGSVNHVLYSTGTLMGCKQRWPKRLHSDQNSRYSIHITGRFDRVCLSSVIKCITIKCVIMILGVLKNVVNIKITVPRSSTKCFT